MARGDHIYVCRDALRRVSVGRTLYTHHAVDMGDGTVIEFVPATGTKRDSIVLRRPFNIFAQAGRVEIRLYAAKLEPEHAAARAESMLGTANYDFFSNNCEHFASWCVTGEAWSSQIENGLAGAGIVGTATVAPSVGLEIVGGLGSAAARSGPNLMSGLSTVGGSAVGGIAVLSGASGLVATGAMCFALRDRPSLPDRERAARRAGRSGALVGAGVGTGAAIYAVGALGVPGYSAAGISSGLAALGSLTGGGMVRGVSTTMLISVLFVVLIGYVVYRRALRQASNVPPLRPPRPLDLGW